jgi:hypothetical protein
VQTAGVEHLEENRVQTAGVEHLEENRVQTAGVEHLEESRVQTAGDPSTWRRAACRRLAIRAPGGEPKAAGLSALFSTLPKNIKNDLQKGGLLSWPALGREGGPVF